MPKGFKGFQKGNQLAKGNHTKTEFKKGHTSWNRGMKMTEEERVEKLKEYQRTHKEQKYLQQQNKRRERKIKLVQLHGEKCKHCGVEYNGKNAAIFSFHHLDRKTKKFLISEHDMSRSWKSLVEESKKCLILCANCHRLIHSRRY